MLRSGLQGRGHRRRPLDRRAPWPGVFGLTDMCASHRACPIGSGRLSVICIWCLFGAMPVISSACRAAAGRPLS